MRDVLAHRDDLLGERVEAPLVGRAVLARALHQPLVVYHQVLDFGLEPLIGMLEGDVVLGLPRDLVVAMLHFVL